MKTTNALASSMRRLLANLHPPAPLTAREGQQLLNVLQKSFSNRLDEQHPAPSQHEFWPKTLDQNDIPISTQSTSSYATNTHMGSILTNPVLGSADGLYAKKDAISTFEKLISGSQVDFPHLTALLRIYTRGLKKGAQSRQHGERLGDRLNSWLHVTDRSTRESFLLSKETIKAALDLFFAERNEAVLWTWLRLVYERRLIQADVTSAEWLRVEDLLVSTLMRLSIHRGDNADAAQQFLEACRYRFDSGRLVPSKHDTGSDSKSSYLATKESSRRLAAAIMFHRHRHGIPSDLFKNVLEHLPAHQINAIQNYEFCAIYSPDHPTAKDLYAALINERYAQQLLRALAAVKPETRKIVMTSILDASKVAIDKGMRRQASFLLNFAIDNFPEHLPARENAQLEPEIDRYLDIVPG